MKRTLSSIVIGMLFFAFTFQAAADCVDFEDLDPGREGAGRIPEGYRGLSWSKHSYWITKRHVQDSGYDYGTVGRVSLFTAFGNNISVSGKLFHFKGTYVTSTWDSTEQVTIEGWRGGSLVYTETITTYNDQARWFDFDFKGIDTLRFMPHGRQVVIDNITMVPPVIEVEIDIKPGSDSNPVNLKSKGRIPVAILGGVDFDVWQVDLASVRFGPNGAPPVHTVYEDVNGDGEMDLVLHFKTQEIGISAGDTEAVLSGKLSDGTAIEGKDSIRIVPRS